VTCALKNVFWNGLARCSSTPHVLALKGHNSE